MKMIITTILLFSKFFICPISAGNNQPVESKINFTFSTEDTNNIIDGLYLLPYGRVENTINTIRFQYYQQTHDTTKLK